MCRFRRLNDPFLTWARLNHVPYSGEFWHLLRLEFQSNTTTDQQVFMAMRESISWQLIPREWQLEIFGSRFLSWRRQSTSILVFLFRFSLDFLSKSMQNPDELLKGNRPKGNSWCESEGRGSILQRLKTDRSDQHKKNFPTWVGSWSWILGFRENCRYPPTTEHNCARCKFVHSARIPKSLHLKLF